MTQPAWDGAMSEGCIIPPVLVDVPAGTFQINERERQACDLAATELDRAYYEGGTEAERALAEAAFRDSVTPIVGEDYATVWYEVIQGVGKDYWGTGRTWDGRKLWDGAP